MVERRGGNQEHMPLLLLLNLLPLLPAPATLHPPSRCLQVKKDEEDLEVGWGTSTGFKLPQRGPQMVESKEGGKDGGKEVSRGSVSARGDSELQPGSL